MTASLAAPLARALLASHGDPIKAAFIWPATAHQELATAVLAALRADPETLAALAEALHETTRGYLEHDIADPAFCNAIAAALADALFGAKP